MAKRTNGMYTTSRDWLDIASNRTKLFRSVFNVIHHYQNSEDVTSKTVTDLIEKNELIHEDKIKGYVLHAGRCDAKDFLRTKNRIGKEASLDEPLNDGNLIPEVQDPDMGPEEQVIGTLYVFRKHRVSDKRFIEALESLPKRWQDVLYLYVFEELSHEEIAARLHISVASSRVCKFRALPALRERLSKIIEQTED